jgi:alanine racemase
MMTSRPILNIDLNIIAQNYNYLTKLCQASQVSAVVKADCYGLGASKIVPILLQQGCQHFFVANYEEAIAMRKISNYIKIYVLNGLFADEADILTEYNLIPVLHNYEHVMIWKEHATKLSRKLPCIVKVDVGMRRLGMSVADFDKFLERCHDQHFEILYIMSHLTSSEEQDNPSNQMQLEKFEQFAKMLPNINKSLANSGGIFLGPQYHFDLVRPGAALYGICHDSQDGINCTVELHAPIIHMHELLPGESIGYNQIYVNNSQNMMLTATIPLGYADGFFRSLSNKAILYIDGIKVPIIGRISMDMTVVDVSLVPRDKLFLGQQVEIIGSNSKISHLSDYAQTNEYEILTSLGQRFKRIYLI